jgi:DNA-binding NarL/FixJ family response regulator
MHSQTILCIEDDPLLRDFLVAQLEEVTWQGTVILAAGDAQTGLQLARQRLPQLVILDLSLPDRSGYEVAAELRRLPVPPKVLIYTSTTAGTVLRQLPRGLAHGLIQKSADTRETLGPAVRSLLAGENLLPA